MSLIAVYHDRGKAVCASDDAGVHEGPCGQLQRSQGRFSKIVVLPGNRAILGTVGLLGVIEVLRAFVARACTQREDLGFDQLAEMFPGVLRKLWAARRPPAGMNPALDLVDCLLLGTGRSGIIQCWVFRSKTNFAPIETTADAGNRTAVLGCYGVVNEGMLRDFTMDVGARGERKHAPWIAAHLRGLIDDVSALHPETIGRASFFAAIDRRGPVALPGEFPLPPELERVQIERTALAHAIGADFFLGSIRTPRAGEPDTLGNADGGAGAQVGLRSILAMSIAANTGAGGPGSSITNLSSAIDGDLATFAVLKVTGDTRPTGATAQATLSGTPGIVHSYISARLLVTIAVPTDSYPVVGGFASSEAAVFYSIDGGQNWTLLGGVTSGSTLGLTTYSVLLPSGLNLSLVQVYATAFVNAQATGTVELDLHDAHIECMS